jgi:glycosyltransferase involved in cell wall biosynthesis
MTALQTRRIFLLGNFPPRRCGIATFTHDVYAALKAGYPDATVDVIAMVDPGEGYAFPPEVTATLHQDDVAAYRAMGRRIRETPGAVLCIQHEYGIFGGPAGDYLLALLEEVDGPVVTTLHTVLTDPNPDQRRVLEAIAERSSTLIVMAQKGVDILRQTWKVPAQKIALIPHGAPDFPFSDTAEFKPRFGMEGRDLLFTFGLLSPGKGLDVMVRAMPQIVSARPDAHYLVLGSTHPHLVAREGEAYREGLIALAEELGVGAHVSFVDTYADNDSLLAYLAAADLYVTPYLNEAQITSGTLSYAVALGKPVVSTPYWHAQELLADGRGVLTPFGDSDALAAAVISLLADPAHMETIRRKAYAEGRTMLWSRLAERYMAVLMKAPAPTRSGGVVNLRTPPRKDLPPVSLLGVQRLTDDCGMFQHATFGVPDRNHGYCLDDNARALMLTGRLAQLGEPHPELERLAWTYASFVQHAWNGDARTFRNFMGYDRSWLEAKGSEDSFGRGFHAVAVTAETGLRRELRVWAASLADAILPEAAKLTSPRAQAFIVLGACALMRAHPGHALAREVAGQFADGLERLLSQNFTDDWRWFEEVLAYDNARLPEALLTAGMQLDQPRLVQAGLVSLDWLCRVQTGRDGCFRPVGSESFGQVRASPRPFDQQPLEAAATVDACAAAYACVKDTRWTAEARRAYDWYMGENDLGLRVAQPETGLCYDGLTPHSVNLNQGAESVLSYQWATCSMHRLLQQAGLPTIGERLNRH